jgi:hypothetical protein
MRYLLLALVPFVCFAGEGPAPADAAEIAVKLKVLDRLAAVRLLPEKGSFIQMQVSKGLQQKLGFKAEELAELKMVEKDGRVTWDAAKDQPREIKLSRAELSMFKEGLRAADDKKEITSDMLNLYELIMGAK